MKTKLLSIVLKEIKTTVTSEQFKKIEDVILDVAEESGSIKTKAAARMLRLLLNVED